MKKELYKCEDCDEMVRGTLGKRVSSGDFVCYECQRLDPIKPSETPEILLTFYNNSLYKQVELI